MAATKTDIANKGNVSAQRDGPVLTAVRKHTS
jgi:hypothetical protein